MNLKTNFKMEHSMENQSEQMKTQIESFFQEEVTELIYDGDKLDEWKKLNAELGITGQQSLAKPEKSPIPFLFMKQNMVNIFDTLCPREVEYKNFDITPIPLEILKLISLSVREEYFSEINIKWDDRSPDPVVIGSVKLFGKWNDYSYPTLAEAKKVYPNDNLGTYNYETKRYLIGKWGDVKHSFSALSEMAITRKVKQERVRIEEQIKQYERDLLDVIINAEKQLSI